MRNFRSYRWCDLIGGIVLFALGSTGVAQAQTQTVKPRPPVGNTTNLWSGYAVGGASGTYKQVSGTWTVPPVTWVPSPPYPSTRGTEYSSLWVGIDGLDGQSVGAYCGDNSLFPFIKLGTEQDVTDSGVPNYYAFYELAPSCNVVLNTSQYPVSAGDVITTTVNCTTNCTPNAGQTWSLSMTNSTKGWSWTGTFPYSALLGTAEWILEAPTINGVIQALPDYGSVGFSGVTANEANPDLQLVDALTLNDALGGYSTPCPAVNGNPLSASSQFLLNYSFSSIPSCISSLVQFNQQGAKLVDPNGVNFDALGYSVALSGDGNTAIVGEIGDNSGVGAAWVFNRSGAAWTEGAKLVGTGAVGSPVYEGNSVALSGDGNTAIVGGPSPIGGDGAAWVFTRSGGEWSPQQMLHATSIGGRSLQGNSVALSSDGNTAIVGAPGDNPNGNNSIGAAWVWVRSGGVWTQQQKLVGNNPVGFATQGSSVALSGDGNTATVGAPGDNSGAGAAWVWRRSGGIWTQQAKLLGGNALASLGSAVALSSNGNIAIVGAPLYDGGTGAAWVFYYNNGVRNGIGPQLIGAGAGGNPFQGTSVALSADGTIAIVGGPYDSSLTGAAWVWMQSGGIWTQQGPQQQQGGNQIWDLVGVGAAGAAQQGTSVALSADGNTAIVGGPYDGNNTIGAVWVFVQPHQDPTVTAIAPISGPPAGGTNVTITGTNFAGATAVNFGSTATPSFTVSSATSITATSPPGSGTVDVTVTTPAATSLTSAADQFTYPVKAHDFNGDGKSDIAWRNTNGDVAIWLMNGTQALSATDLGNVPTSWSIVGQRQLNNGGYADLIWRNTNGDLAIWFMNGTQVVSATDLGNVTTSWSIAGTSAYNATYAELIWRNTNGDVAIWQMNGTQLLSGPDLGNVPNSWTIVGTGDFSGTGNTDILWRDTAGDVAIWFMNGTQVVSPTVFGNVPTSWAIVGTGDFNGDGKTDILWRNANGDVAIWLMNGTQVVSGPDLGNVPANWTIAETGDFNGDGNTDILWRDTAGDVAIWFMNGTTVLSIAVLGNVPTAWTIQGANAD